MARQGIYSIVVIGAGPAGIAAAVSAVEHNYNPADILILEKSGEVAHMIQTKYPDEKAVLANYKGRVADAIGGLQIGDMSKIEFMDLMRRLVIDYKLQVNFHEQVQKIERLHNGQFAVRTQSDVYLTDTVFVAIGTMAAPRSLGVAVEPAVAQKVFYDLQGIGPELHRVLVVGGGDSAGEYAKILVDRGHEVTLSYRQREFSRMIDVNRELTQQLIDDGKLRYLAESNVKEISEAAGRPWVQFKEHPAEAFDAVVTALGNEKPRSYLESIGVDEAADESELFNETPMRGVFLVGDLGAGRRGGTINLAFNSARQAFQRALRYYLDTPGPR